MLNGKTDRLNENNLQHVDTPFNADDNYILSLVINTIDRLLLVLIVVQNESDAKPCKLSYLL